MRCNRVTHEFFTFATLAFPTFVTHSRTIQRNLCSHVPVRVRGSLLLYGSRVVSAQVEELILGEVPEGAATGGEDNPAKACDERRAKRAVLETGSEENARKRKRRVHRQRVLYFIRSYLRAGSLGGIGKSRSAQNRRGVSSLRTGLAG